MLKRRAPLPVILKSKMYLKRRSFLRSRMRSRNAIARLRFSSEEARQSGSVVGRLDNHFVGPMPFILSNMPSACLFRVPSMPSAGNLFEPLDCPAWTVF